MKNSLKIITLTTSLLLTTFAMAEEVELDRVSAIINSSVVLESDVNSLIKSIKLQAKQKDQSLPSDKALRTQVMDKLINDSLILQIGERMGVQISDAQLDETLANMAKENELSLEQFRQQLVTDGENYEKYRENVRTELISGEVRRASMRRRINVSPQEIGNLIASMKAQTSNNEEYNLGLILIEFPTEATQEDMNAAKIRAEKVIELLNSGSNFTKIAIASSGHSSALDGGDMGWKNINEMPTLFSELVDGKPKDAIFGPIRTGLGFSIVKILDIRGRQVVEVEEVEARHIVIMPSVILSEAKVESMLQGFLDQVITGEADFAELAKEHSQGPTGPRGGNLGWADPANYDPAFKDALASLQLEGYHKPFRSSFGWHIAQLTGRRSIDATNQINKNKAYQMLYNRKLSMESARWMKETRDDAYIEIFDLADE